MMKKWTGVSFAVAVLGLWLCSGAVLGQDAHGKKQSEGDHGQAHGEHGESHEGHAHEGQAAHEGGMSPEEMQKAFEAAAKVGPNHELLHQMEGEWTVDMLDFSDPTSEPQKSTGKSVIKPILGGRFMEERMEGSAHGESFTGIGVYGFDNVKGKFVCTWKDSMSTGIFMSMGEYDKDTKTLTYTGPMEMPGMGTVTMIFTSKQVDADTMVGAGYMQMAPGAPKMKNMEMTYKRVK